MESHFLIGNAQLYLGKDDCEETALNSYHEARLVLENNLKRELGIPYDSVSGLFWGFILFFCRRMGCFFSFLVFFCILKPGFVSFSLFLHLQGTGFYQNFRGLCLAGDRTWTAA